jgi:hypothetical protein
MELEQIFSGIGVLVEIKGDFAKLRVNVLQE